MNMEKIEIVLNQIDNLSMREKEIHPNNHQAYYDLIKAKIKLKQQLKELCLAKLLEEK